MALIHSESNKGSRWNEPWWSDYRPMLAQLGEAHAAGLGWLNDLLPAGTVSGGNTSLRFVPASSLRGVDYERHIFETGDVSTREGNWHDLFNALVWCRLPRLKAAMNALHYAHLDEERAGRRGPQRDALTLLDESGAIVVSRDRALLEALSRRDWRRAFVDPGCVGSGDSRIVICGHALLEKLMSPYKSITAHVLLLHLDASAHAVQADAWLSCLDQRLADGLLDGLCRSPADLSPLPLMGIPRWWPAGGQDAAFYADTAVFRPPPSGLQPAPIRSLRAAPASAPP